MFSRRRARRSVTELSRTDWCQHCCARVCVRAGTQHYRFSRADPHTVPRQVCSSFTCHSPEVASQLHKGFVCTRRHGTAGGVTGSQPLAPSCMRQGEIPRHRRLGGADGSRPSLCVPCSECLGNQAERLTPRFEGRHQVSMTRGGGRTWRLSRDRWAVVSSRVSFTEGGRLSECTMRERARAKRSAAANAVE